MYNKSIWLLLVNYPVKLMIQVISLIWVESLPGLFDQLIGLGITETNIIIAAVLYLRRMQYLIRVALLLSPPQPETSRIEIPAV